MVSINGGDELRSHLLMESHELIETIQSGLVAFFTRHYEEPLCVHHVEAASFKATFKRVKGKDVVIPLLEKLHKLSASHRQVQVGVDKSGVAVKEAFSLFRATAAVCKHTLARCNKRQKHRLNFKKHDRVHLEEIQFYEQVLTVSGKSKAMIQHCEEQSRIVTKKLKDAVRRGDTEARERYWAEKKRLTDQKRLPLQERIATAERHFCKAFSRKNLKNYLRKPLGQTKKNAWKTKVKENVWAKTPAVEEGHQHSESGSTSSPPRFPEEVTLTPSGGQSNCPSVSSVGENNIPSIPSAGESVGEGSIVFPSAFPGYAPPEDVQEFFPTLPVDSQTVPEEVQQCLQQAIPSFPTQPVVAQPNPISHTGHGEVSMGAWLQSIGKAFVEYTQLFEDNAVTVEDLATMTHEDLKEIGVSKNFHRRKLLQRAQGTPSQSGSSRPASLSQGSSSENVFSLGMVRVSERSNASVSLGTAVNGSRLAERWLKTCFLEVFRDHQNRTLDASRFLLDQGKITWEQFSALRTLHQNGNQRHDDVREQYVNGEFGPQRKKIYVALQTLGLTCSAAI